MSSPNKYAYSTGSLPETTTVDALQKICDEVLEMKSNPDMNSIELARAETGLELIITANPSAYTKLRERQAQQQAENRDLGAVALQNGPNFTT